MTRMDGGSPPGPMMPSLLSYVRPFRYDRVSRIAVVETGPSHLVSGVLGELRRLFPDARSDVLLREEDAVLGESLEADRIYVVRYEDRPALVRSLRAETYDLVVLQLTRSGVQGLRSLPFALRGTSLMAFNDSLDHFPVNVFRVRDLASHFGLLSRGVSLLLAPLVLGYLLLSTTGIRVRGWWRRLRRPGAVKPRDTGVRQGAASASEQTRSAVGPESV